MVRILVVDDKVEVLDTLGPLLKSKDYVVVALLDGRLAIDLLDTGEVFDLLITDIRMAPVNGLQLIAHARHVCPTMDIVVVSSYLDDETIGKARALGCTAYIRKPYSLAAVLQPVREIIARREKGERPVSRRDEDEWIV